MYFCFLIYNFFNEMLIVGECEKVMENREIRVFFCHRDLMSCH